MLCATASWSREGKTVIGGSKGNDSSEVSHPYGLFIDSNNLLFIVDSGNNRVIKLEEGGSTIVAGFASDQLNSPSGISIDKEGSLFILDRDLSSSGRVTRWSK